MAQCLLGKLPGQEDKKILSKYFQGQADQKYLQGRADQINTHQIFAGMNRSNKQ